MFHFFLSQYRFNIEFYNFPSLYIYIFTKKYIFSLGWSTDPRSLCGYTEGDIDSMLNIIEKHKLVSKSFGKALRM